MDESVTVKGSPVRSLQKFLEAELTAEERQKVFDALPGEFRTRFDRPILSTETVPLHMLNRLTEEAAKVFGEPVETFAHRAGREAASDAVKGIYRFFVLVLTPPALLSKASQMWSTLYNRGTMRVEEQTATSARLRVTDFPASAAGCARITGWIERMAEMTGVKDIHVEQTQCSAKGAEFCEWQVTWT
ncbi:MAG: TIGR02265 family protein [Acidobacteriota bacterium]